MMIPGVIAFHLYGPGFSSIDEAYPKLVSDLLPGYLAGIFLAVLLGAVFSSFNSLLNSGATLFALDIYAPLRKSTTDTELVKVAKIASVVIALFSFAIAPLLYFAKDFMAGSSSIYRFLQYTNGSHRYNGLFVL